MEVLYGLHPVEEALRAGKRRFDHVLVARERHDNRLERLAAACRAAGVTVRQEPREQLTVVAQSEGHQGVVAMVHPLEFLAIEDLFEPNPLPRANLDSCWRWMGLRIRRTWERCCAWPMARA